MPPISRTVHTRGLTGTHRVRRSLSWSTWTPNCTASRRWGRSAGGRWRRPIKWRSPTRCTPRSEPRARFRSPRPNPEAELRILRPNSEAELVPCPEQSRVQAHT
eukprot:1083730-Rhodomonas_salina.1